MVQSFEVLNTGFDDRGRWLQLGRNEAGKSHISLAPLLMISQRQAFVALDALSARQAYQAWVLLRPGIESALFMGKWMDDVENYRLWVHKAADPGAYRRAYSGKALASHALPRSDDLQRALKAVNDLFVHTLDWVMGHVPRLTWCRTRHEARPVAALPAAFPHRSPPETRAASNLRTSNA